MGIEQGGTRKLDVVTTVGGTVGVDDSLGVRINPSTEDTLQKLVGFDVNDNITVTVVTVGVVKTIAETDGVKTRTTVIDKTDPNNFSIISTWS